MKQLLLDKLLEHKNANVAGVGVLRIQQSPAQYQVADREFIPPQANIEFEALDDNENGPDQQTVASIAKANDVSEEEAFDLWSQEAEINRNVLHSGKSIQLGPFGKIELVNNQAVFVSSPLSFTYPAISAERVMRQDAVHTMKVGDTETDSRTMEEWLQTPDEKVSRWWIWPLILAAIAVLLIVLGV